MAQRVFIFNSTRLPRLRAVALGLCAVLATLFASLWLLSQFRFFALIRETGTLVRKVAIPDGQMGAWEYTLTTWSLQTNPHQLRLVRGTFLSVMQREAEKDLFADRLGWEAHTFPRSAIGPERYPWFAFEHNAQWRILGFGPTRTTWGGQTAHTFDLPYWLPIVIFGTPVLLAAMHRRRQRTRLRDGRCLNCGYQLDAPMTTCPECGGQRSPVLSTRSAASGDPRQSAPDPPAPASGSHPGSRT